MLIPIILSLIIWGLIFSVLWWGKSELGLAEPFNRAVHVLLVILAVVIVLGLFFGWIAPFGFLPHGRIV